MTTDLRSNVPVLKFRDTDRSLAFFSGRLGVTLEWRAPGDAVEEVARQRLGGVAVMLGTRAHFGGESCFTGTDSIDATGVEEHLQSVQDRVDLVRPLDLLNDGSLEFGFRDPDRHAIAFSEVAPHRRKGRGYSRVRRRCPVGP
jgi:hypothetical protein